MYRNGNSLEASDQLLSSSKYPQGFPAPPTSPCQIKHMRALGGRAPDVAGREGREASFSPLSQGSLSPADGAARGCVK